MGEWNKVTWGDYSTMPHRGELVECHRKFMGGDNDTVVCWRMVGWGVLHVPLNAPPTTQSAVMGMFGLADAHRIEYQVSIRMKDSNHCDQTGCAELQPDTLLGRPVDTLWWRELDEETNDE